jgi:hypothetical protein
MKKAPLFIKILAPAFVLAAAAGVFFGIKLMWANNDYSAKTAQASAIEAIAPAEESISYTRQKQAEEYESMEVKPLEDKDILATYKYENITFTSYSDAWDEENLESLCDELLKNTHGSEMDYLQEVIVHGGEDEQAAGRHHTNYEAIKIPVRLFSFTPYGFTFSMPNITSILTLYNGDEYISVEEMSITLSHEYGHHFTFHYFTLKGEDEEIEKDAYFKARYESGLGIRYSDEVSEDENDYYDNHMWYLVEIAAEDYVYLMGSPTTRRIIKYYDSKDLLIMDVRGEDDRVDEYYDLASQNSFNQSPHENILIPLPDQVEGLPELFYGTIGLNAPEYTDRNDMAQDIEIKMKRRNKIEKTYYKITWNKPWTSKDVIYTLVAYDENDELLGSVKSISGKEDAEALIGSVVYETKNYYHWYDSDRWTNQGFLRFRVIVTFSDGTAAVSPPVDRSFS